MKDNYELRDDEMDQVVGGIMGNVPSQAVKDSVGNKRGEIPFGQVDTFSTVKQ